MTYRISSRLSTCLSRPVLSALLAGTCSLAAYAPRLAAACAPPLPGLTGSTPADGETYPANAALLFEGFYLGLDGLKVTVDGVGAELVPADLPGFAALVAGIEPQPLPGQTVVISGNFCPDNGCDESTITFTAGEPDVTPPVANPAAAFFGVYDHADFVSSGGDCQSDSDFSFYLHLEQEAVAAGQAPELVRADWQPNGDGGFGGSRRTVDGSEVLAMSVVASQLGAADPTKDVCFTVTLIDAAGNAAAPYDVCPACFFRKDDVPVQFSTPMEPAWTDADAVPGSACAGGGETTGEDETSGDSTGDPETGGTTEDPTGGPDPTGSSGDPQTTGPQTGGDDTETSGPDTGDQQDDGKGCACATDSDAPAAPTLAALALLMLIRPRRRA